MIEYKSLKLLMIKLVVMERPTDRTEVKTCKLKRDATAKNMSHIVKKIPTLNRPRICKHKHCTWR